jgi:signal transduction histidine kinase/ligand-binding sensor domain-containing protein
MDSIAQTSDGFLWFTSPSQGIYRFDGVRFVSRTVSVMGTTINAIAQVHGDHAGGLWVLGAHEVVHLKSGAIVSHFELEWPESGISEDADGSLWFMRGGKNLDAPLCHVSDRELKCFGKADGVSMPMGGDALLADGKGGFWLGGQTALLHWHNGVSQIYPIKALSSNTGDPISGLALDSDGSLWAGMEEQGPGLGLGRLVNGSFQSFIAPGFDGSKIAVHSLILDRDGSLWVGTIGNGLFRIRGNVVEHYGRADGLSSDSVNRLFEDREGILWVTTSNGIDSFHDPRVTTFSALEGLGPDAAMGVLASRDGTIWVANGDSLDHIGKNGAVSSIRWGKGLPGDQVSAMLEDRAGNLWVGVYDGLYLFKNGSFRRIPEPDRTPLGLVGGLTEDIDGNIWAECFGASQRLLRIHDFQVREEFSASRIPPGCDLAADPHGGIWICTQKGSLALLRNGTLQEFSVNPKTNISGRAVIAQADGSVLAGSIDGLIGLRLGKVQRMTTQNGLPCNSVLAFVQDNEKRWWLYTRCGIVELPNSELQRWWANPEAVLQTRTYDALDGARSGIPTFNPAAYSSDGRVWFATGSFVQMVDPSRISNKALPAVTYIESVTVDRKEFAATDHLGLSPHPQDLEIDYTSPTFTIPQKVRFRYRLDGYDHEWNDAGTRRQAFYTDLPPGKYSFRVIACNSDGVWNDSAAKLDFSVAPAYYQTNWFRVLCAVCVLALLWGAYQLRVRQVRQELTIGLEAMLGERTRIARELHDTLLQSFHGLLYRFHAARNLLPGRPDEAVQALDSALIRAEQALDEGRQSIQALRSGPSEENDLDRLLIAIGQELASTPDGKSSSPSFNVIVEGERRELSPTAREEVFRVARELLQNAFRHALARAIEAEIRYDKDVFRMIVRDDGKGIDPQVLKDGRRAGHWGMPGVYERASAIGARLEFWSEAGAGTEVRLTLPAALAYQKSGNGGRLRLFGKRRVHERES